MRVRKGRVCINLLLEIPKSLAELNNEKMVKSVILFICGHVIIAGSGGSTFKTVYVVDIFKTKYSMLLTQKGTQRTATGFRKWLLKQ